MESVGFKSTEYVLSYISVIPLLTNIISAVFCLGCSAAFHLYSVKSKLAQDVLSRLDYGGISVLIFGSSVPIVIYGFACDGASVLKWSSFIVALILDLACVAVTFIKKFD
jgi:adiponectin receptor